MNVQPVVSSRSMRVTKRDGSDELVELNAIVEVVRAAARGVDHVDPDRVAVQTIAGLRDGVTTRELDELAIQIAASLTAEEPEYSRLAARLLARFIDEELEAQAIHTFSASVERAAELGLAGERLLERVRAEGPALEALHDPLHTERFEYFGLRTLFDRYLLRHPETRAVLEGPQHFFLRIATALTTSIDETRALYEAMASLSYLPSSPTLFNAGTRHEQLSSCFLLDSPQDELVDIYKRYADIAKLSKFSGGIGVA